MKRLEVTTHYNMDGTFTHSYKSKPFAIEVNTVFIDTVAPELRQLGYRPLDAHTWARPWPVWAWLKLTARLRRNP